MAFCPECGSRLVYDRESRSYVCERCGGTYTQQDLLIEREKNLAKKFVDERKRRDRTEYLEWWLSAKESR
ncbi:MAG: TFIIB-type zinc ribbon-containing protein [Nitrososphaerota archaeon]